MINPNLFVPSHRKMRVRGGKFYLPTLKLQGVDYPCRGRYRTATSAQARAREVLGRWSRLYGAAVVAMAVQT